MAILHITHLWYDKWNNVSIVENVFEYIVIYA